MTLELVVAILALAMATVMVAGKVIDFAKQSKKNGNGGSSSLKSTAAALTNVEMRAMHDWSRDLHTWHSKEDDDGRKIWYNDRSIGEAMKKIGDAMTVQTEILRRMSERVDRVLDDKDR